MYIRETPVINMTSKGDKPLEVAMVKTNGTILNGKEHYPTKPGVGVSHKTKQPVKNVK